MPGNAGLKTLLAFLMGNQLSLGTLYSPEGSARQCYERRLNFHAEFEAEKDFPVFLV